MMYVNLHSFLLFYAVGGICLMTARLVRIVLVVFQTAASSSIPLPQLLDVDWEKGME